ncbi:DUF3311 domain-containing protein [Priestia megaterium]|jgi:hypothetical protein|uniref:DUF3311 domain-containing protein n=1 Tax=Priestia megaterium TaxID=1404 RepID=UPI000494AF45|nr:DUF3311 domain-containing protein [Priestia megaterium]RFB33252.1 DUF3311 domain-containing protein [Bacillus sp. RC]MBV6738139.1 DUF3311 domain-containing protein [Priestia megaterium]MBW0933675.1 DUF3311 domain-containing protein [Priestia megaterium]MCR8866739.1 DUF3311 domain-containing protein [Priestia megaterium]MED3928967.1 DUF3311 domain-containing protein [Priestia megaterium]
MVKILIWILGLIPVFGAFTVVNRIHPYIFGLPLIVFWATAWLILTSVFLSITNYLIDRQEESK